LGVCGLDSSASRYRKLAGSCEHGIGFLDSKKCGEFIKKLRNYWLHKKVYVPWISLVIALNV
jgi:hypothetical protein